MQDRIMMRQDRPQRVEGHVCLELKDPISGKIKERINGRNHIFENTFFMQGLSNMTTNDLGYFYSWNRPKGCVSFAYLCLQDTEIPTPIDDTRPYLVGQTLGYGMAEAAASGSFRGAYNAVNSFLAKWDLTKVSWQFQYDFSASQANGTIKCMGLSHQFGSRYTASGFIPAQQIFAPYNPINVATSTGRYKMSITTAGIVKVIDLYGIEANREIDISAIVDSSTSTKSIGYDPNTGKCYVWRYSSTAANRLMFEYENFTFSNYLGSTNYTNCTSNNAARPFYRYGNTFYFMGETTSRYVYTLTTGNAFTSVTIPYAANNASGSYSIYPNSSTCGRAEGIWMAYRFLYDPVNNVFLYQVGSVDGGAVYPYDIGFIHHGNGASTSYGSPFVVNAAAIAAYNLPSPIEKTSANTLTATYAIDVYW